MKLKSVLLGLALVMLMASVSAATTLKVIGDGWLDVWFSGHDVLSASVDSTLRRNNGEIGVDHLLAQGDVVVFKIASYPLFTAIAVAHGYAEYSHTQEDVGLYGTSVQSNSGIGVIFSEEDYLTGTAYTVTLADSDFTISQYAANFHPDTEVGVTYSNLGEDGLGYSEMVLSWLSNSLSSDLSNSLSDPSFDSVDLSFDGVEWNGGCSLELTSNYEFSVDMLSLWQTLDTEIEIIIGYHLSGLDTLDIPVVVW